MESFDLVSIIDLLGLDLLVSTPLSDLLVAGSPYQILWGRTGNDTIYPYEKPGLFNDILPPYDDLYSQLYVMLGDFEFPQIDQIVGFSRTGNDTFALGDWRKPFLVQDSLLSFGLSDFALLADFETSKDVLQLHGSQEDYTAIDLGFLTILLYNQEVIPGVDGVKLPNVVALALGSIDLGAEYIYYMGSESPVETEPDVLQIGSTGVEVTDAMTVDSDGNIFIAGSTTGYLGPDPFGFNRGLQDGWIRKYSPDGTLLASIQLGSEGSDNIFDIVTDEEGNVYAVGNSSGSLAGAQPETFVGVDAWIARIDKDLNQVEWIQRVENDTFQDEDGEVAGSYSIELGGNGNLYISGVVEIPTAPGSEFPVETGNAIASYTKSGDLLWYRQYSWNGQTDYEETYSGALDADGNFYRAGFTTSRWPEDPDWFQSDVSQGQQAELYDVWLTKHGPDGTPEWIRSFGTGDFDWIWGVDTDSTGNIYVGGITLGTLADTVDSTTAQGGYDTFIAKFDALGNSVWLNQVGSNGDDQLFTLQVSPLDDLIVGGWTNGSFGSSGNQGSYDAFLMSLSPDDGEVIWENTFGTERWDGVLDLAFSNEARAYALGITDSSLGARNTGAFDSWLAEFDLATGSLVGFPGATEAGLASIGPGTQQIPSGTGGPNGNATELEKLMTVPPTSQEITAATLSRLSELTGINPADFSEETLSSWLEILSSSFVPYGPPPPPPPPPTYNIAVTEDGQGIKVVGSATPPAGPASRVQSLAATEPQGLWVKLTVKGASAGWQNGLDLVRSNPGTPGGNPQAVGSLGSTPNGAVLGGERHVFLSPGQELRFVQTSREFAPISNPTLAIFGSNNNLELILDDEGPRQDYSNPDRDFNDLVLSIQSAPGFAQSEDFKMASRQRDAYSGILDLTDLNQNGENLKVSVRTNSRMMNSLRFVKVVDDPITGLQVGGVSVTDSNFLNAVRANLSSFSFSLAGEGAEGESTFTPTEAGLYAPVLVTGNNDVFTFGNSTAIDGLPHLKVLGQNTFAFEDLTAQQRSDFDYNDFIVNVSRTPSVVAASSVSATTPTAEDPLAPPPPLAQSMPPTEFTTAVEPLQAVAPAPAINTFSPITGNTDPLATAIMPADVLSI